ncbi:hypothetical protein [Vagococcus teuberi]
MKSIKYYEFKSDAPYYALLKATDKDSAITTYQKYVADIETEDIEVIQQSLKELSFSETIHKMRQLETEDGDTLTDTEILDQLIDDKTEVLAIDRDLV